MRIIALLLGSLLAAPLAAQQCVLSFTLTAAGNSGVFNNLTKGCTNWTVTYNSTGFSALSLTVQTAPNSSGSPGTWATFTAATGSNPSTSITQASATFTGYFPFLRVNLSGLTGTGTVSGLLYGAWNETVATGGSAGNTTVIGPNAPGSPSTANPVQVAGNDGTNVRALKTDTSGNSSVVGPAADGGSTVGLQPVVIGGQASGNLVRQFGLIDTLTDASATGGRSLAVGASVYNGSTWDRQRGTTNGTYVQGPVAAGSATAGNPVLMGGVLQAATTVRSFSAQTLGNVHSLAVSAGVGPSGNTMQLATSAGGGLRPNGTGETLSDGATNTPFLPVGEGGFALFSANRNFLYNGTTWDRARGSATAGTTVGGYGSGASGTLYGMSSCDSSAVVNVAAGATTELVSLTASRSVRVCGFAITADTAASTAKFVQGTGTNCGTGTADLTGAMAMGVASNVTLGSGLGELFKTTAGNALCLAAVTGTITGVVTYAKF